MSFHILFFGWPTINQVFTGKTEEDVIQKMNLAVGRASNNVQNLPASASGWVPVEIKEGTPDGLSQEDLVYLYIKHHVRICGSDISLPGGKTTFIDSFYRDGQFYYRFDTKDGRPPVELRGEFISDKTYFSDIALVDVLCKDDEYKNFISQCGQRASKTSQKKRDFWNTHCANFKLCYDKLFCKSC